MATSVSQAFSDFMDASVNLAAPQVKSARNSRDWLIQQIHSFPEAESTFPRVYQEVDIQYGSFARKTKIRPLDDIDIMIGLHAESGSYWGYRENIEITMPDSAERLRPFCEGPYGYLNSRKVINKFISQLEKIPQYDHAEIKRNQEAATLKLKSHEWNFDIVPCFFTQADATGRTYYLIPDGSGKWKMTDPRLDRDRASEINAKHDGHVLPAIRIMKFWNRHRKMTTLPSYLLENLLLDYYESAQRTSSPYVDIETISCLAYVRDHIIGAVQDPKKLQGDLNTVSFIDRLDIVQKANQDCRTAVEARNLEKEGDHRGSLSLWRQLFGEDLPKYEN